MLVFALSLGTGLMGSPARAGDEDTKVAVAPLAASGDVSEVAVQRITEGFVEGLKEAGLSIVPPDEVAKASKSATSCAVPDCLGKVAKEAGATHAVRLAVSAEGRDYTIGVTLTGADGSVSSATADCPICGFDEVADVARQQAVTLAGRLLEQDSPAFLDVTSTPAGALVTVDGEPFGTTPVREQLPQGKHVVRIELDGYVVRQREVTSTSGVVESLDVQLEPVPNDAKKTGLLAAGGTLIALGIGGIAGGATLLSFHHKEVNGRCDKPENIDTNGLCRWRYDTLGGGIGALAAGVVAAGVGVGLVIAAVRRDDKRGKKSRARLEPRMGGLAVAF